MRGFAINTVAKQLLAVWLAVSVIKPLQAQPERGATDPALAQLAEEFHDWLTVNAPVTPWAIDRLDRPAAWAPDWSRTSLQDRKVQYLQFQGRLKAASRLGFDVADRIDAAILGAAMERVHWQIEVLASPRRDPGFYLDQSLGNVFEILVRAPQPSDDDLQSLTLRLQRFTSLINSAKLNLDLVVPALAEAAMTRLGDVDARMDALEAALLPDIPEVSRDEFLLGIRAARQSLASFKDWLSVSTERFNEPAAIGPQRYRWYLSHVAQVPSSPETLLAEAEQTLAQLDARLAVVRHRHGQNAKAQTLENLQRVIQMASVSGPEIAVFIESANLVELPAALAEFRVAALPRSLAPLAGAGAAIVLGDLKNGASGRYLALQRDDAGFVEQLAWVDPRLLLTWDALPGRHAQAFLANQHPRPIRHRAVGPSLGEGIGMYFHIQIAEAGLYAFSPASFELALKTLRYHAAKARADVLVATGNLGIDEVVDELVETAGLSPAQAARDVQDLLAHPGVAGAAFAAYGQVIRYLADSANARGETFDLAAFNVRLLRNAHVPIALQRWEALGLEDELDALIELRGRPATVPE